MSSRCICSFLPSQSTYGWPVNAVVLNAPLAMNSFHSGSVRSLAKKYQVRVEGAAK